MDGDGKNLIVTGVPTIEIDGLFFQDHFKAAKYLIHERGMRVFGALRKVEKLVNEALNRPVNEGRRDFLKLGLSTASAIMCQGLGGKVDENWARDFWKNLSPSYKSKARRNYLQKFLPHPGSISNRSGSYDLSLFDMFTEGGQCDMVTLDDMIVRDLPQALSSARFLRHLLTGGEFTHIRLKPYKDADALTYLSDLGCKNIHRSNVSKIPYDTLRHNITKFYDIVDANPLLQDVFSQEYRTIIDTLGDIEEATSQEVPAFVHFTRRLHDIGGISPKLHDNNQALLELSNMRKRVAEFLKKHSKQTYQRFNLGSLIEIEKAQALREMQSDDNWYHAREILPEPLVRKDVPADPVMPSFQRHHDPEMWLRAFDGMLEIAEIFELK